MKLFSISCLSLLFLFGVQHTLLAQNALKLPPGVSYTTSVEGITEYRLANGLQVLLFPDPSKQIITVNITYKVGSRHEGYGETGMAHLLEHLVFKGTPKHPNIPQELTEHGARPNGTTSFDRTNYFETFDGFMERFGDMFLERPTSLDELLEVMAQRMAAMQALLNSMSPEQRAELAALSEALMEDMDLRWQMEQLSSSLQSMFPDMGWSQRYSGEGSDPIGLGDALRQMDQLGEIDRLEQLMRSASAPGALSEVVLDAVRRCCRSSPSPSCDWGGPRPAVVIMHRRGAGVTCVQRPGFLRAMNRLISVCGSPLP